MNDCPLLADIALISVPSMERLERMPVAEFPAMIRQLIASQCDAPLYMSQFRLFSTVGNTDFALEMQARALELSRVYRVEGPPYPGIRLLALMGAGAQSVNMPLDYLLSGSDIRLDLLYILPGIHLPEGIPDHDVAIIALGESDEARPVLETMHRLTQNWPRPVLNAARFIQSSSRDAVYQKLKSISRVQIPPTFRVSRRVLEGVADLAVPVGMLNETVAYPLTLRPLVSMGGSGLEKIENPAQLQHYLEKMAEPEFFISRFVDYQSPDGLYRKLRIALIAGEPYLCHLAISDHWIVHYGTAGMAEHQDRREEEARVMQSFDTDFGLRHGRALREIAVMLELDYVVLDCAQTRQGELLVFEADNRGWVHASDPVDSFAYKQQAMQRVFAAFRAMLFRSAAR